MKSVKRVPVWWKGIREHIEYTLELLFSKKSRRSALQMKVHCVSDEVRWYRVNNVLIGGVFLFEKEKIYEDDII